MAEAWNRNDFETFLKTLVDCESFQKYTEPVVSFCLAYCGGNIDRAMQIRQEFKELFSVEYVIGEHWFRKCCLLFGAERDLRLVEYVVEKEGISREDILRTTTWVLRAIQGDLQRNFWFDRNALLSAMDSGREDIVMYLLREWIQSNVSIPCKPNTFSS